MSFESDVKQIETKSDIQEIEEVKIKVEKLDEFENEDCISESNYMKEENDIEDENDPLEYTHFMYDNKSTNQVTIPSFICSPCSQIFTTEQELKDHICVEIIQESVCNVCNKTFPRSSDLTRHFKIHEERKFECHFCGRKFIGKSPLRDHIRTHTGERPFKCHYCDYRSAIPNSLRRHIRTHTGEKLYNCKICPRNFGSLNSLKVHTRTHTGEKPYPCDICEYRSTNSSGLSAHKRNCHSQEGYDDDDEKGKKYKRFTGDDIKRFLIGAPDESYLMMKVALILMMHVTGACTQSDLQKLSIDDIKIKNNILTITIPDRKHIKQTTFSINSKNMIAKYRKYARLRPRDKVDHKRFFLNYKSNRCTHLPVGKNNFTKIPKLIAEYLNLPDPELYSGRSIKKTSIIW